MNRYLPSLTRLTKPSRMALPTSIDLYDSIFLMPIFRALDSLSHTETVSSTYQRGIARQSKRLKICMERPTHHIPNAYSIEASVQSNAVASVCQRGEAEHCRYHRCNFIVVWHTRSRRRGQWRQQSIDFLCFPGLASSLSQDARVGLNEVAPRAENSTQHRSQRGTQSYIPRVTPKYGCGQSPVVPRALIADSKHEMGLRCVQ
jgi:hypothetical protein